MRIGYFGCYKQVVTKSGQLVKLKILAVIEKVISVSLGVQRVPRGQRSLPRKLASRIRAETPNDFLLSFSRDEVAFFLVFPIVCYSS